MTFAEIVVAVAEVTGVQASDIVGPRRHAPIARARDMAVHIACIEHGINREEVAASLGRTRQRIHQIMVVSRKRFRREADYRADMGAAQAKLHPEK